MIFAVTLAMMTLLGTLPAPDLVDDLAEAGNAEFVGRQLVVCWGPDGVVAHITDIEQSGGMTMVTGPDGAFIIGEGKMIEQYAGGVQYLEMSPSTDWRLWEGYSVRDGRSMIGVPDARAVEIYEGSSVRARFSLDPATSAPLSTEVYNGDGKLYRYSSLIELEARGSDVMVTMDDMPDPEQRRVAVADAIPAEAGHYWAADSYAAPGGVQVFFTDGSRLR